VGNEWSKEIRYLELEFLCMEACIIRHENPIKALSIIRQARKLYKDYGILSDAVSYKFEFIEISL
jgi:hypothetical protein